MRINRPDQETDFVTGAYSDGDLMDGFLFVRGQASVDFKTSEFVLDTVEEETRRTLKNIKLIVEAAGGSMEDVVKINAHLADIADFSRFMKSIPSF